MAELPLHPTEPHHAGQAAPPPPTLPHGTPPSQRLRCPHCHNPIQLADGHSDEVLCPACGHTFRLGEAHATTSAAPMRPLGKFQLLERIGAGGFGAVWKAQDTALDRTVALKIPHTGVLTTAADLERFQREARAAAQLRHPGIVPVHDVVMLEGLPTIISDFVTGVPLKDLMETRRLSTREVAVLLAAAADAVHYAHSMGVVHRDLKPGNILVPYAPDPAAPSRQAPQLDRPLLMDFGLALRSEAEVTMTQDGHVLGTPAYMSPEQASGRSHQADARSDVWGLGVVLYELLTGELPFRGSKVMMLMQVMNDDPKPPRRLDSRIPRDLETVCLKCLQKEPARRYATAAELSADLRRFLNGEPVLARRVGRAERLWRWSRRNPAVASLLATVALLLIAGTTVSTYFAVLLDRKADTAEKSEAEAKKQKEEAEAAREEAQVALAHSWLGPLGLRYNEPLIDAEISALWQLAEGSGEGQWERFVREALRTPETTRQLRNHAGPALHAAIGLDSERRADVERLLLERMQDTTLGADHRTDVALAAVALENQAPAYTAAIAGVLAKAMSETTDVNDLNRFAQGLSALAGRMEPKDARRVSRQAAGVLGQVISNTTDANTLSWLAYGLSPLAEWLESKDAAVTAAVLAQAISKTTNANTRYWLAQGLSVLAVRLEAKDAARVSAATATVLARAMRNSTDANALNQLAQGLSALAARLEPKDAATLAAVLVQAMSTTNDANVLSQLAQGLSALAARLEAKDAAAPATVLVRAMSTTNDANALSALSQGLSALAARLAVEDAAAPAAVLSEAIATAAVLAQAMRNSTDANALNQLAQGLSALAGRLEAKEAARVSAEPAAVLAKAMLKTTDTNALNQLAQGVSALAARLEVKDSARVSAEPAAVLAKAVLKTTDANALNHLAQGLSALAPRLEFKDAARSATFLFWAMRRTTDANGRHELVQCLSALGVRLDATSAARIAVVLAQAMSKTTDGKALSALAQGLSALAVRLEAKDAAATAVRLVRTMSETTDGKVLSALAQGLSALAARLEAKDAAAMAATFGQTMSKTTDGKALSALARGLSALAARLESKDAAPVTAQAAAVLVQALSKTNNVNALNWLAQGLSALSSWLESTDAAVAAAALTSAISKTNDSMTKDLSHRVSYALGGGPTQSLVQSLKAVLNGCDPPERSRRVLAVAGVVGTFAATGFPVPSLAFLGPAVKPLPCRLSTQQLVDLLKQPTCQDPARRVVLDYLQYRYHRRFRNHWDFVEYAREHLPGVDLTTPPKRPGR